MTPEEQRGFIARACGWEPCRSPMQSKSDPSNDAWRNKGKMVRVLPDYLSDLNACHEMEKVLTQDQCFVFQDWLIKSIWDGVNAAGKFNWHATAAQRCEAFLKTLGLWVDG